MVLAGLLACGMAASAQASLADLFHHAGHSKHQGKIAHSTTPQHLSPLLRSARQKKVQPVLASTRTTAKTIVLKRAQPH
jgi:hypothetical protein